MKKMLMLASVASMIGQFNISNIEILQTMGYEVHVACNFDKGSAWTEERIQELKRKLRQMKVHYFQIDFERNVMKLNQEWKAYKQVLKLARKYHYTFIHCHSPIGGVVGRLVGHKTNTRVIYTAHGFHFYKGAPIQNWLIYYPIEKFLSRFTDVLITINQEDYHRAKRKFHAKRVEYVPGVGIDVEKFRNVTVDIPKKRAEFGISPDDTVLLSVGELNKNKNQEIVIKALVKLHQSNVKYLLVGQGTLRGYLEKLARELGVEKQVIFLGFRQDVAEIYKIADIFVFPSKREGLSVALMEAMASDLICIASDIRGNRDLILNKNLLFDQKRINDVLFSIENGVDILRSPENRKEVINEQSLEKFSEKIIKKRMRYIYISLQ
ncbi:hypothetical protein B5E64_06210 [Drancourtella sp. An12]|uniref:glycosyltransferase family 4 protein n=1 Tax=Drancourtella sp. An12 TaxID=1965548 RepID=UPI000B38D25E|nr:glycosyltransferase family 4 protein [Drancourtella sp. An12]OUQ46348.1 hypothetical protein B5E64_06210 [Drancourtella sp. An12]